MSFVVKHEGQAQAMMLPAQAMTYAAPLVTRPFSSETVTIDFRSVVAALLRRKLLVLAPLLLLTGLGLAFALLSKPKYTSSVQILVDPRDIQVIRSDMPLRQQSPEAGATLAENTLVVLRSRSVLTRLVDKEKLYDDPEFAGTPRAGTDGATNLAEAKRLRALNTLEKRIAVRRADRSSVVEASIWTGNAEKSARLANVLAEIFIALQQGVESDTARKAAQTVASRLDELGQRVQQAERDVEDYKARNNLQTANGKLVDEQQLQELNSQLVLARARATEARSKYDSIRKLSLQAIERGELPDANNSGVISQLRLKYAEASRLEADARTRLGARHPEMTSITAQVRDARQLILDELSRISRAAQGDFERARAAEASLTKSLDQLRSQSSHSGDAMVRLRELERLADASRTIYNSFLKRTRELSEQEDFTTINARVISPATPAESPSGPGKSIILAGSIVAGTFLGLLFALLAEQFDSALRSRRQFQQSTGLPVLGEFPPTGVARTGSGLEAHVMEAPRSAFANSACRVADLFAAQADAQRPRTVLFLTAGAGTQGTEAVLNVAIAAAQATWRVLMVDADGSGGGLGRHLDVSPEWGLGDVIERRCGLSAAVLADGRTGVRILPQAGKDRTARALRPSPQQIDQTLLAAADGYELIFIDGGIAGQDATAFAIAAVADDLVLVARNGATTQADLRDAMDMLTPFRDRVRGLITV